MITTMNHPSAPLPRGHARPPRRSRQSTRYRASTQSTTNVIPSLDSIQESDVALPRIGLRKHSAVPCLSSLAQEPVMEEDDSNHTSESHEDGDWGFFSEEPIQKPPRPPLKKTLHPRPPSKGTFGRPIVYNYR